MSTRRTASCSLQKPAKANQSAPPQQDEVIDLEDDTDNEEAARNDAGRDRGGGTVDAGARANGQSQYFERGGEYDSKASAVPLGAKKRVHSSSLLKKTSAPPAPALPSRLAESSDDEVGNTGFDVWLYD